MNSDSFDRLQKNVLAAVRQNQTQPAHSSGKAKTFGLFVDECRKNRKMSRTAFAEALEMEPELAAAILDGLLPESELNDDLLAEIAVVIGYQVGDLQMLLGRAPKSDEAAQK
jgi:hypothetical protein